MNPIISQEAFQMLRRAGCTEAEIDRLARLRRTYQMSELDQPPLDLSRLQFVRWLVTTGRLTDQLAETEKQSNSPLPQHPASVFSSPRRLPFLFF